MLLTGDPARIGDVTRYLEGTVGAYVGAPPGCHGLAV